MTAVTAAVMAAVTAAVTKGAVMTATKEAVMTTRKEAAMIAVTSRSPTEVQEMSTPNFWSFPCSTEERMAKRDPL